MAKKQPYVPTTALDFCQVIGARQHSRDAVQAVSLEPAESQQLDDLLAQYARHGEGHMLEERARTFLVVYREREQYAHVLSDPERTRLDELLARQLVEPTVPERPKTVRRQTPSTRPKRGVIALGCVALAITIILGGRIIADLHQSGPPAGTVQQHQPAQHVAPGTTDLQNLKQNYGPFQQLTPSDARPQTNAPALLLLEDNSYFASTKWQVAPASSGWQADLSGSVDKVNINGTYADITDSDSVPYVVGVNQAFIVSSNPGTVLRVDPTGDVFSMSLAQATAVRQALQ